MRLSDYSPPSSPTLDQQRDALQKGLGRAMQWALAGRLDDEPLLAACLVNLCHDPQVEQPRGGWLWRLIHAAGAVERLRVPILHALYDRSDDHDAEQLCEFAAEYARAGDETFRTQLYEVVARKSVADHPTLGEDEIMALDGEPGFLAAASAQGTWLATHEWDWHHDWLIDNAIERFGEGRVVDLLNRAEAAAVVGFRDAWRRQQSTPKVDDSPPYRERTRAIGVREVLAAAEAGGNGSWSFQSWGRYASRANLARIARRLRTVREPAVLVRLINVFLRTPFPRFDARLLELCRHADGKVRRQAHYAVGNHAHPAIREFALSALEHGARESAVLQLFVLNFERGDERRILDALDLPDDVNERHWLLHSLVEILEENPEADASELAMLVYASTPCENCRYHAVRLLHGQNAAPSWLIEECRFDSNERCRNFIDEVAPRAGVRSSDEDSE